MNATILNREFQHPTDGWYMIEAKGNHPNRSAGVVQVIDDTAITSIVNRFNEDAQEGKLRHGNELLIDHEHFSGDSEKESRAYGWLQELQNRTDGIYGRIRWTTTGKAAVDGGDYRFFSTEYAPADLTIVNDGKPRKVRPLRLDGLSLTNMPNNRGQKPITNRNTFPGASASGANQNHNERTNTMKSIALLLGLAPEASEEAILGEATKLKNRLAALEPHEAENQNLKNRVNTLEAEQCDQLLDLYQVKDEKARATLKPLLASLKNREDRVTALTNLGHKLPDAKKQMPPRVINRGDSPAAPEETPGDEQALTEKITNRANELKGQNSARPFSECFAQARRELVKA